MVIWHFRHRRPDKRVIDVKATNRVTFAHYGEHTFRYITFCMYGGAL
jgi:hypothetical protein